MWLRGQFLAVLLLVTPAPVMAQNQQTLADIRQELNVLYVEVQRLRRELSTTGAPTTAVSGTNVLDRVTSIESELQRLTRQTEQLENRVNQVVADGTNRIGDLEFRLVELEGGDVSKLGQTTTLGGDGPGGASDGVPVGGGTPSPGTELAVGEQADYDAAAKAMADGDNQTAAARYAQFVLSYPGSPLAAEAALNRGLALEGLGDTREAARAYLASFTAAPTGPVAADALYRLGAALGRLGQVSQACVTLGEVGVRFPASAAAGSARQEMANLSCS